MGANACCKPLWGMCEATPLQVGILYVCLTDPPSTIQPPWGLQPVGERWVLLADLKFRSELEQNLTRLLLDRRAWEQNAAFPFSVSTGTQGLFWIMGVGCKPDLF